MPMKSPQKAAGVNVTLRKMNRVQYTVAAPRRPSETRDARRETFGGPRDFDGAEAGNFRSILWEFKNNSIRARGSLGEIC